MFENKDKNQPVTIGDFEEFADMVVNNFATKDEVRSIVKDEVEKVLDNKIGPIIQDKVEKVMGEYVNIMLDSNDKLVKKLDTFETERTVLRGHINDHEDRITVVEKHVGIAPASVSM